MKAKVPSAQPERSFPMSGLALEYRTARNVAPAANMTEPDGRLALSRTAQAARSSARSATAQAGWLPAARRSDATEPERWLAAATDAKATASMAGCPPRDSVGCGTRRYADRCRSA